MKLKKWLAMALSAALLLTTLAGCGGGGESESSGTDSQSSTASTSSAAEGETATGEPEPLTLPLSEDGAELDVYVTYSGTIVSDLNTIEGVKKMEEMTGVHVNWTTVSLEEVNDRLGILLSSGDYPDIVYPGVLYPGGP